MQIAQIVTLDKLCSNMVLEKSTVTIHSKSTLILLRAAKQITSQNEKLLKNLREPNMNHPFIPLILTRYYCELQPEGQYKNEE